MHDGTLTVVLAIGILGLLVGAVVLLLRMHHATLALAAAQEAEVATRGYAIGRAAQPDRGSVTLVWGRFDAPLPFYLRVSSRDPLAAAGGSLGFADLPLGDGDFDARFVVRTNRPEWARGFLTPERRALLMVRERLEFVVSSPQNLLSAEWYAAGQRRDLRELWMVRADGALEGSDLDAVVVVARTLAAGFAAYCADLPRADGDTVSPAFEAR